jgi:hypothetical protein
MQCLVPRTYPYMHHYILVRCLGPTCPTVWLLDWMNPSMTEGFRSTEYSRLVLYHPVWRKSPTDAIQGAGRIVQLFSPLAFRGSAASASSLRSPPTPSHPSPLLALRLSLPHEPLAARQRRPLLRAWPPVADGQTRGSWPTRGSRWRRAISSPYAHKKKDCLILGFSVMFCHNWNGCLSVLFSFCMHSIYATLWESRSDYYRDLLIYDNVD